MQTYETQMVRAYERGLARGSNDLAYGIHTDSPLSGEWAGESIPELLGDILNEIEEQDRDVVCSDLFENYEEGYATGNQKEEN